MLNCRVRDGNGCDHRAIATGLLSSPSRAAMLLEHRMLHNMPFPEKPILPDRFLFEIGEIKTLGLLVPVS